MKIDPDLLRTGLLHVEEHGELYLPEDNRDAAQFHAEVLFEDGYITGIDTTTLDEGFDLMDPRLTVEGRRLAAEFRNDTLWNRAKSTLRAAAVPVTIEAIRLTMKSLGG